MLQLLSQKLNLHFDHEQQLNFYFSLKPIISPVTKVPSLQYILQTVPIGEGKESHSTIFPSNLVILLFKRFINLKLLNFHFLLV